MTQTAKKKAKEEPELLTVKLRPSVAEDLVVVLRKFSDHNMGKLLYGETNKATRLLGLNLFRVSVEAAIQRHYDGD